jgi:membrane associated rhomboid family serine protease
MPGIFQELISTYQKGGTLIKLIFINSAVFILFGIVNVFYSDIPYWLSMPSYVNGLIHKPWTLLTYMFYHKEILHFLFNVLNLYWFGKIFLVYFSEKKLLRLYLIGGIIGGLLYFLVYNAFPDKFQPAILMGASASIMAIIIAVAVYAPNFKVLMFFIGEVKLIYIGLFSFILSIILIASDNPGGNIAHVGGAMYGFLWVKLFQKGKEFNMFSRFFNSFFGIFKRRKMKVTKPPINDLEYNRQKNLNQEEIDRILDKISKGGYDSLSKTEKETLFNLSNKSH